MQTPLESDIELQSYEQFIDAENKIKLGILTSFFVNITNTISATSDSFTLFKSQY